MSSPLMELISSGEGGYNSYNRGTRTNEQGKKIIIPANQSFEFTQMTIAEIQRHQRLPPDHNDRVFAIGKYQLIPETLDEGIHKLHIDPSEKLTAELQDRLFNEYILPKKRPEIFAYITGKPGATLRDAQKATCLEWASVEDPDTPGHVYEKYEKHGNKMHIKASQVAAALDEMRVEYKAQVDNGLSAEEAWRATASMGPGQFEHLPKATARPHVAGHVLREGARSPAVGELQTHLRHLGYTDAHDRPLESDHHFGPATRAAVERFQRDHGLADDGIVGPATRTALSQAVQFTASTSLDTTTIRTLQSQLNALGVTDMHQKTVHVSGVYDLSTRTAVARFQSDHGMPITGQADEATRTLLQSHAFIADLQRLPASMPALGAATPSRLERHETYAPPERGLGDAPVRNETPLTYADPNHPQHALYAQLKELLPPGTTEARLAQSTAACYRGGIKRPQQLHQIHIHDDAVHFLSDRPDARASIDLIQPAPTVQQTMEQVQAHDQQHAQMQAQFHAQQAQVNAQAQHGPVMGGHGGR